jgi:hypothetical protein
MKAKYFFKRKKRWIGTEKLYMLLQLSAEEQTKLEKRGGFDQILAPAAPFVKESFLKEETKFSDGSAAYVFRSLLKDLDFVRKGLEKEFGCECDITNINDVPTYASLLLRDNAQ